MCFSAGASFAGAAIITAAGVASVSRAEKGPRKIFASVPLIFGLQQFSEGLIWLTLGSGTNPTLLNAATIFFLITALIVWPVMMPAVVWLMEPEKRRRSLLLPLVITGAAVGIYYTVCMFIFQTQPMIENNHIRYSGDFPRPMVIPVFLLYLLATITPLFISSVKKTRLMGILILFSVIVSGLFYKVYLTSVWCFFAALISVVIYLIVKEDTLGVRNEKTEELRPAGF